MSTDELSYLCSTVWPHDGFADVAPRYVPKSPCVSEPSRPRLHLPGFPTVSSATKHRPIHLSRLRIALTRDYPAADPSIWLNHSTASLQSHFQPTGSTPVLASNFVAQRGVPLTLPQAPGSFQVGLPSNWTLPRLASGRPFTSLACRIAPVRQAAMLVPNNQAPAFSPFLSLPHSTQGTTRLTTQGPCWSEEIA
jgi:hypothetical protein